MKWLSVLMILLCVPLLYAADTDDNSYPDVGDTATGHYIATYRYDAGGNFWYSHGDGFIEQSAEPLQEVTTTECKYKINYRGAFENTQFLKSGWIRYNIRCNGFSEQSTNSVFVVHESDRRYDLATEIFPGWSIVRGTTDKPLSLPAEHITGSENKLYP